MTRRLPTILPSIILASIAIAAQLLSPLSTSTAHAAEELVSVEGTSEFGCLVKPDSSQLVANSGVVLDFSTELKRAAKKSKAVGRRIARTKTRIRALSKSASRDANTARSKARRLLKKLKVQKAGFAVLIASIEACRLRRTAASAVCGNGVVEAGETCDGNCPLSCPQIGCTVRTMQGSVAGCDAACASAGLQTACVNADGCCPAGCTANNDGDCKPVCGNAVLEQGESCDGTVPSGNTCESLGFSGGVLSCDNSTCALVTGACVTCAAGETACGASCVSLASDVTHCGACGTACSSGQSCSNGVCVAVCGTGQKMCGNACATLSSDPVNCGACGTVCSPGQSCTNGRCSAACQAGQTNCAGSCVNLASSATNCGGCGSVCPSGAICSNGTCSAACGTGLTSCGGACVNLGSDSGNCGACGTACPSSTSCMNGQCAVVCQSGSTNCGGSCRNLQSDSGSCGACGTVCASGQVCSNGVCGTACASGLTNCGGSCVNLSSNAEHCGACGTTCPSGQSCSNGRCRLTCPTGQTECNGACRTLGSDINNCGACGRVCSSANAASICSNGVCGLGACRSGFSNCDGLQSNGCETPLNTNSNCSSCGDNCLHPNSTASCQQGLCSAPVCDSFFCNADKTFSNGCETLLTMDPTCGSTSPIVVSDISGDTGLRPPTTIKDIGEKFYMVVVREDLVSFFQELEPSPLRASISLKPSPGTDYDLDVFCSDCNGSIAVSQRSNDLEDEVVFGRDDFLFTNETYTLIIRVRVFDANSCSPWTLTISGNTGARTHTCNP